MRHGRQYGSRLPSVPSASTGFTKDALDEYEDSTPFITMDGGDLMAILDERIRLDDMLRRKKRHMNETGSCYFPASEML
jgi:hypothetical protein